MMKEKVYAPSSLVTHRRTSFIHILSDMKMITQLLGKQFISIIGIHYFYLEIYSYFVCAMRYTGVWLGEDIASRLLLDRDWFIQENSFSAFQ